jgi:hypothetical protein
MNNMKEEFAETLKKRLYARLAKMATQTASIIVREHFDMLDDLRSKGLPWDAIAEELTALGCAITPKSLATTFARAKKVQVAPLARGEGGKEAPQAPLPATTSPVPAPAPAPVIAPAPAVSPEIRPAHWPAPSLPAPPGAAPKKPFYMSDEDWEMKPKIDLILDKIPDADREYPELRDKRLWTDPDGEKWDVLHQGGDRPEHRDYTLANMQYGHRRQEMLEKYGIAKIMNHVLHPCYNVIKEHRPLLTVNLDDLIATHLI